MALVAPSNNRIPDENDVVARARKYAFLKAQLDFLEKEQKELRLKLFENLEADGEEDDKGNIVLELPEQLEGGYHSVIKQRRVSRKVDETIADEIITEKGLEDTLYKTIRVVDEDALMAALFSDILTEQEVDAMYPSTITWALVLKK